MEQQPDRVRDGRQLMDHVPPDPRFWLADVGERIDRAIAGDLQWRAAQLARDGVVRVPMPRRYKPIPLNLLNLTTNATRR